MTFAEQPRAPEPASVRGAPRATSRFSRPSCWVAFRTILRPAAFRVLLSAAISTGLLLVCAWSGTARAGSLHAPGALESAGLAVKMVAPRAGALYGLRSRVVASFSCHEGVSTGSIATCTGTATNGDRLDTSTPGSKSFTVTATDTIGNTVSKTVHYRVLRYTNPLSAVRRLLPGRIDQGVDYAGWGPILALGAGKVLTATDTDSGWPGGGWLLYKLSQGRFAGKYVYVAENITVRVKSGQTVTAGEKIATLHAGFPNLETGWASDIRDTTLANADGHLCPCGDAGGWSSIEGRNFNHLLVVLGARSGYLQANPPKQSMPPGWPELHAHRTVPAIPRSPRPLPVGWTSRL